MQLLFLIHTLDGVLRNNPFEKYCYSPQSCKTDERKDYSADKASGAAEQKPDYIKLKKSDRAPVYSADDCKCQC